MNEQYVRKCCLNYAENKEKLREINAQLSNYGSLTQNFSDSKGGFSELSAQEKRLIRNQKLEEQRALIIKQIRVVDAAAKLEPVIHMTMKEGLSIRRYAETYKTTYYDARKQFDNAIKRFVAKSRYK